MRTKAQVRDLLTWTDAISDRTASDNLAEGVGFEIELVSEETVPGLDR